MGLFDKLKEKSRGVLTSAPPSEGVAPQTADEVRSRLLAISGKGVQTGEDEGQIVVAWSAKVASAGVGGGEYEYVYRAIRIELDEGDKTAAGVCFKTNTNAEVDFGGALSGSKSWERGQHIGSETVHILAWLGPHQTEGGADEKGYKFSWGDLRDPVIDAVTGAGWTYKPRKV